jgi:hypothetical protein
MMNETQTTVWMTLDGQQPVKVDVSIGVPEEDPLSDNGDMRTSVSLSPVISERWICGVNALQSLTLAVHFVVAAIQTLEAKGCRFSLDADEPQLNLTSLLTGTGFGALKEEITNTSLLTYFK